MERNKFHNYLDIERYIDLLKVNNEEVFKNLSLYKDNLFDVLYYEEKTVPIIYEDCKQSLSEYFILNKLIREKKNYIYFSYDFKFIQKINDENENYNESLRKIIISKIILNLIYNYEGLEDYNEKDEIEIDNLKIDNFFLIEDNFSILKNDIQLKFTLKDVIEMEVDDLYIEIIYALILNQKIEDFNFVSNIFKQMNLDLIDVSKEIYEKYLETLYKDNKYINKYLIRNSKHMSCPKKIYFYYILFNYILKDPLYINKNPFLNEVKNNIQNITNNNLDNIPRDMENVLLDKLKFVVKTFLDCDRTNINIKNEIKNEPYSRVLTKDSSTHMTFNSSKASNENSPKNIKNIFDEHFIIKSFPILNESVYSYDDLLSPEHTKIKKEKNINNAKTNLYFIEQIISDKLLLEEKNYEHFLYYCLPNKKWGKVFISDIYKNEFKINKDIVIKIYNSFFKGGEDKLIIYNKTLQSQITYIKGYSFPLGFSGFTLINNKILICPCKTEEESGFFYLVFMDDKRKFNQGFKKTLNFKVTSICPLLSQGNKDIYYFLVAGIGSENKIKIKLCKLMYNYKTDFMDAQIIEDNIYIHKDKNFKNFEKPIFYIKQSTENGHIFIYSEKKIYHFSSINISKYLEMDEIEKTEAIQLIPEKEKQKIVYQEKQKEIRFYSNS